MNKIRYNPIDKIHSQLQSEMEKVFLDFYQSQNYILGRGLRSFEEAYADFSGTKYAIGVGNGYDALLIILRSLGIGKGDEVILPAHTFIATLLSVINSGAKPVLTDIDAKTFCISPELISDKIRSKTKAIIPVHIYGNPCDMSPITQLADSNGIAVIEDNAQAHGATYHNKKTGSIGKINFTSFYPTKNLGALGDGGMITTNDQELANTALSLRNYGKDNSGTIQHIGVNSRLDELQARILNTKLKHLGRWNQERIAIANLYDELLAPCPYIHVQSVLANCSNVRHIYPILTPDRNELQNYLTKNGVETLLHYPSPLHLHPAVKDQEIENGDFPESERICDEELSLPIYPGLKEQEIRMVAELINDYFER